MKIICIGRNYVEHIQELSNEVPASPVFFMKPDTALVRQGIFFLPKFSNEIHHEIELVLKINQPGKNIAEEFAHRYFDEITVGIDFTARDIQQYQKEKGLPWEPAKAFDGSAPVGDFVKLSSLKDPENIRFRLDKNGKSVQEGSSKLMIHSFAKIISYISMFCTLKKGDLIFTGTPKGVASVAAEDVLTGFLEDRQLLRILVR